MGNHGKDTPGPASIRLIKQHSRRYRRVRAGGRAVRPVFGSVCVCQSASESVSLTQLSFLKEAPPTQSRSLVQVGCKPKMGCEGCLDTIQSW